MGFFLILTLLLAQPGRSETGIVDRIQSVIDDAGSGLDALGRKVETLVGSGLGIGTPVAAKFTQTRTVQERYPVGPTPVVSVSNKFGRIQVNTWMDRVVEVRAEVVVGAETAETAGAVCEAIEVKVSGSEEGVKVQTFLPDTRRDSGLDSYEVNYLITIPETANLMIDNAWGDTVIRGTQGVLAIESQYGAVDLGNISGPVKARLHGEFPLMAQHLSRGGVFVLSGTQADFSGVAGELRVSNFRGKTVARDIDSAAEVDITGDSSSIELILGADAEPDLNVSVLGGALESDIPLTRAVQGETIVAHSPRGETLEAESGGRVVLSASFGDVRIKRLSEEGTAPVISVEGAQPFNEVLTRIEEAAGDLTLAIDGAVGDVTVEGVDEEVVRITATRIVWTASASAAPAALAALGLEVQRNAGRLVVNTVVTADMTALGCPSYRIDLHVQCPRTIPLEVHGQRGLTAVSGVGGALTVNQAAGAITVQHSKGRLTLSNQNGDVKVAQCSGPLEVSSRYGTVEIVEVFASIQARCSQGHIAIEAPEGDVQAQNSGGNISILALKGIRGEYEVLAEDGTVSLLAGPDTDAAFTLKATGGRVRSRAIPLDGTLLGDTAEFRARVKDGLHRVYLEARNGDVLLD